MVPLADARLFAYLTKAFASVPDVSVVLERRSGRPANAVTAEHRAEERRTPPRVVSNFGCSVIRRPAPVAPEPPARPRTLLWPNLRITDVLTWTEEGAPRGIDVPPPKARAN